ncbi:hypothetical protein B0H14DRAFT_2574723 [Mycena olivaceomarginata]|nr:hypothetical protein B0H14DRAFT_2574723 [Mycena olivaceomarginata]
MYQYRYKRGWGRVKGQQDRDEGQRTQEEELRNRIHALLPLAPFPSFSSESFRIENNLAPSLHHWPRRKAHHLLVRRPHRQENRQNAVGILHPVRARTTVSAAAKFLVSCSASRVLRLSRLLLEVCLESGLGVPVILFPRPETQLLGAPDPVVDLRTLCDVAALFDAIPSLCLRWDRQLHRLGTRTYSGTSRSGSGSGSRRNPARQRRQHSPQPRRAAVLPRWAHDKVQSHTVSGM